MTDEDLDNLLALAQRIEAGGPINVMPRAAELLRELVTHERATRSTPAEVTDGEMLDFATHRIFSASQTTGGGWRIYTATAEFSGPTFRDALRAALHSTKGNSHE